MSSWRVVVVGERRRVAVADPALPTPPACRSGLIWFTMDRICDTTDKGPREDTTHVSSQREKVQAHIVRVLWG